LILAGASLDDPPSPQPGRAYDHDGNEIRPMSLGNMREHGVRSVAAHCQESSCGHSGTVNVDGLPDDFPVPDVALRLRCSRCGSTGLARRTMGTGLRTIASFPALPIRGGIRTPRGAQWQPAQVKRVLEQIAA
jgi:hypothetical protein